MDGTIALMLIEALLILLALLISKAIRFISPSLNGNQPVAINDGSKDEVNLSETVSPPATKYDVFLSFRGEDTRHTFASYLYKGLRNAGIHTFMDHELQKGENISPILLRTIEESEISLIIFSENYANSTWCMEELVHILECKKKFGRVVISIFYNVDPSNIRKQNGGFGKGFDVLKDRFKDNQEKLQKWRNALVQSTSLSGWDSNNTRPEFKLVEEIVQDTLSKLNYKPSSPHLEGLVGIAHQIEKIEKLLSEAHIVGIWGMGGAGKTTLAKSLFQVLRAQFDAFSFIENVKGQLEGISLDELQQKCLKQLLKDNDISIYDIQSNSVKNRLGRKKILLVLDDVDNSRIAKDLTKVIDWFGKGSKIIMTSRDRQVLKNAYAFSTYHVPDLDFNDAIHLFSLKAFKQHEPYESYMELSKAVVKYCKGNPLALVVLGCFLYCRGKEEWESALDKLNQDPPKDIVDVLKLSFDGLDDKQQNVFLDLAFFIKESVNDSLDLIRQLYGSYTLIEISVLAEKSLLSFNQFGRIVMHDLVNKMGLKITREQLFSNAKSPIRLWRHEDIAYFFNCGKEIEAIRCMSLDVSKIKRITLRASSFRKMHNLIFLKIYKSDWKKPSMLNIRGVLDYFPEEMRFFSWEEYPVPYVPLHICAENLIILKMRNSNIQQLWKRNQHFPNLKKIDVSYSKYLTALPDISHAPKIKYMFLEGCVNLARIHSSTTILGKDVVALRLRKSGPKQIKVGGSMKGTSPGLIIVYNYLDLENFSFHKVTLKVFVHGKNMSGIRYKHVVMALEKKEVRKSTQSLASLLPFVRRVDWLEGAIEFGHDFSQHYTYHFDHNVYAHTIPMKKRSDRGERSNDDKVVRTLMKVEEEEVDDDELIIVDYSCSNAIATLFTRVPKSISRWSLLKKLMLKKSDGIGNINEDGSMIGEDSILKSLAIALSYHEDDDEWRRIKPLLDVQLSFHNITPPSASRQLMISYDLVDANPQHAGFTFPFSFNCKLTNGFPDDFIYDSLIVTFLDWRLNGGLRTRIKRKRGEN